MTLKRYGLTLMAVLFPCWIAQASPAFLVVSDVDDTVRVTDVQYPIDAAFRFFFSHRYFAGMSELYSELASQDAGRLVFVSGSPRSFSSSVCESLQNAGFKDFELHLKPSLFANTANYKTNTFEHLFRESSLPVIFLGDDTEHDPEITIGFQRNHPERTLKVYIHTVTQAVLPEGAIGYYTAFEVALHEVIDQRLRPEQALRVGERLMKVEDYRELFPQFSVCPHSLDELALPEAAGVMHPELRELSDRVASHLLSLCWNRPFDPRSF